MIKAGTINKTDCADQFQYREEYLFHWDGQAFHLQPGSGLIIPIFRQIDHCALIWALRAGSRNDTAHGILSSALSNWPNEADVAWGPAARDYFRLKLATWQIQRGQVQLGLDNIRQVRDNPLVPEFNMTQRVAAEFLDAYADFGWITAVSKIDGFYQSEMELLGCVADMGCRNKDLKTIWGFAELYGFTNDFLEVDSFTLAVQAERPDSLPDLTAWLMNNGFQVHWSVAADLDGHGPEDWLVELEGNSELSLAAFLRTDDSLIPIRFSDQSLWFDLESPEPRRMESFQPEQDGPKVHIIQTGGELHAFYFDQTDDGARLIELLNTSSLSSRAEAPWLRLVDWKVEQDQLIVDYNGQRVFYQWDPDQDTLVPTGSAYELQEDNVTLLEQALYLDDDPATAVDMALMLLSARLPEEEYRVSGTDTNPPRIQPYLLYLLGLAYERSGDETSAVRTYWQLIQQFPTSPYTLAAQSKLVPR